MYSISLNIYICCCCVSVVTGVGKMRRSLSPSPCLPSWPRSFLSPSPRSRPGAVRTNCFPLSQVRPSLIAPSPRTPKPPRPQARHANSVGKYSEYPYRQHLHHACSLVFATVNPVTLSRHSCRSQTVACSGMKRQAEQRWPELCLIAQPPNREILIPAELSAGVK